ncbi:MAG: SRPBCC family protein [Dysgonamonadaceae bacterium]|jgi:carbon monoxide dehydrogenase subunit G|nr:SRPBCC family protein [Dysgonamonadaceae bacterium]
MTNEFVSPVRSIPYPQEKIYAVLSDLTNLEKVKDRIPVDKVQDFEFDKDSCSFSVNPVGKVRFSIVDREAPKTIKFAGEQLPVQVNLWIQLKEVQPDDTKLKLTVKADLNPFLKPMLSKPLQDGVNKMADVLAAIPYGEL